MNSYKQGMPWLEVGKFSLYCKVFVFPRSSMFTEKELDSSIGVSFTVIVRVELYDAKKRRTQQIISLIIYFCLPCDFVIRCGLFKWITGFITELEV